MKKKLNAEQRRELTKQETIIKKGTKAFFEKASALLTIREKKLWVGFETFTEYCKQKWEMTPNDVSRYVAAGMVLQILKGSKQLPENEGQARVLAKLNEDKMKEVWQKVVSSGKKITAALIADTAGLKPPVRERKVEPPVQEDTPYVFLLKVVEGLRHYAPKFAYTPDDHAGSRDLIEEARSILSEIEKAIRPAKLAG